MLSVSGLSERHLMPLLSPSSALLQLELYAGQQLLEHTLVDKVQAGVDLICTASKLFEAPAHEKQNLIVCQTELSQDHNAVPLLLQTSEPTLHSVSKVLSKGIIPAVVNPVSSIEGSALAVMMDRGRRRSHRMDLVLTNVVLKLYSLREENEIILANLENSIRLLLQLNSTLSVPESDAGRVVQDGNVTITSVEASLTSEALPDNLLEGSTRQKYRQQTIYTKRDLKENGTPFCRPNDSIIQTTNECTTKMTIPCAEKGQVHEYNSDYLSSPCSTRDPLDSYLDRGGSLTSDTLAGISNDHSFPESN
ncbi:unnamed protein product [Dicrocoelium dendriticum]|nr:unnamed protein product [Dicrocoelium dendriticum]